ncbi:MAG TPA: alcohol dehydrogenase catalytic domain-containing protein [Baekduia sp.]|jgi:2-desacetyl-2-hydroxyethyl bacteriochlorophyllide A dehydrogenase|nr:alcohol dehydrogenase catalytic domain-containing protein [Baekduia sp.]
MRALVYEGAGRLDLEDRARPEPAAGEVVARVLACGICGTDLRIAKGAHRAYPDGTRRVPGHELVAEISALGAGVNGVAEGDRVFVAPNLGCGRCPACRAGRLNLCREAQAFGITFDGGFAEYVRVPAAAVQQGNLLPVPAGADAAALSVVEPLACVLRGQRAVGVREGDRVLVCGAGPIGLLHVLLARAAGAATVLVSEPHGVRRAEAVEFGADVGIDPTTEDLRERVLAETDGLGADVVITAVPVAAVQEQAFALAAVGGRINFFGGLPRDASTIRIDSNDVHYRELLITGTTANDTDDCRAALELATSGRVDLGRLVTARFGIDRSDDAFAAAAGGRELKVVIEP